MTMPEDVLPRAQTGGERFNADRQRRGRIGGYVGLTGVWRTGRSGDSYPVWTPDQQTAIGRANMLPFNQFLGGAAQFLPEGAPDEAVTDIPFFGSANDPLDEGGGYDSRVSLLSSIAAGSSSVGDLIRKLQPLLRDPDQLVKLQLELVELGYLEAPEAWGVQDGATLEALQSLSFDRFYNMDKSWQEFLVTQLDANDQVRNRQLERDLAEAQGMTLDELEAMKAELENTRGQLALTNKAAARDMIQNVAKATMGKELADEEVEGLIAGLHAKEREHFWANDPFVQRYRTMVEAYDKRVAEASGILAGTDDPAVPSTEIDAFMQSIAQQESGGNPTVVNGDSGAYGKYQFMPGTWRSAAAAAGVDPSWPPKSEEDQDRVARHLMSRYYRQFGNWRDVAVAWYAGPGNVGRASVGNKSQGRYPTINQYAEQAVARMQQYRQGAIPNDAAAVQRMQGILDTIGRAVPGTFGDIAQLAGQALGRAEPAYTARRVTETQRDLLRAGSVEGQVDVYEQFDAGAHLREAAEQAAGPEAGAFQYLQQMAEFESLLGGPA